MSKTAEVSDLLLVWEEAREKGQFISPEQLCRDRPELLPELKKQIAALEQINPWLRMKRSQHTLAYGPETGLTSEIHTMLRSRLRIIGCFLLMGCVIATIFTNLVPAYRILYPIDYLPMYLVLLISLALVIPLFTRWQPSMIQLRVMEVVLFGAAMFMISWFEYRIFQVDWLEEIPRQGQERKMALIALAGFSFPWMFLIILYGVFIPNSWRRCALVTILMGCFPLLLVIWIGLQNERFGEYLLTDGPTVIIVRMTFAVAIAIYGSHRINALEKEAFEAKKIGQYRLTKLLGSGGMGEVYLAEHQLLRRPCAIKLIRPERAGDGRLLKRFEREVRAMATLTHWNTVDIYDYGHAEDGTFYYVMEYLPGLTLEQIVERHGPMPPARAIHILRQVCSALHEAHNIGLIHRDIKPSNIILCERGGIYDVVKLLDFGLVKTTEKNQQAMKLTMEGMVPGTPLYMSPEQAADSPRLDARSDLGSLGAVSYFLLSGKPPFVRDTVMQVFAAHMKEPVEPLRKIRPDIPEDLETVVMRCLEKDPARRFPNALSLEKALAQCQSVPPWTQEEAAEWWQKHGVKGDSSIQGDQSTETHVQQSSK